jgi:hypothetical protein
MKVSLHFAFFSPFWTILLNASLSQDGAEKPALIYLLSLLHSSSRLWTFWVFGFSLPDEGTEEEEGVRQRVKTDP